MKPNVCPDYQWHNQNKHSIPCISLKLTLTPFSFSSNETRPLGRRDHNQHGLGSKATRAILLCPWERHFSPAWWSWQAVLTFSYISIKLQADSNILASPKTGWGNCLPYVLAAPSLSCESGR